MSATFEHLYADVLLQKGVARALNAELVALGSTLHARGFDELLEKGSPYWASIRRGRRKVELTCAEGLRLFVCSGWEREVRLLSFQHADLGEVAKVVAAWLGEERDTLSLPAEFSFVHTTPEAEAFIRSPEAWLAQVWQAELRGESAKVAAAAYAWPHLRRLRPYTSVGRFGLSRTLGAPDRGLPLIRELEDGRFRLESYSGTSGEFFPSAEEAVRALTERYLPEDTPAAMFEDEDSFEG
jgi:hypothetical protein